MKTMVSSTNPGIGGSFTLDTRICPGFFDYLFSSWDNLTKKRYSIILVLVVFVSLHIKWNFREKNLMLVAGGGGGGGCVPSSAISSSYHERINLIQKGFHLNTFEDSHLNTEC